MFDVYMMIKDKPNVHSRQNGYNPYLSNITALNMLSASDN